MEKKLSVLFVGESWVIQTTESKGVDSFTTYRYEECAHWVANCLTPAGIEFTHIPCHRVEFDFPESLEEIQKYDVVMFSDVGANTLLLPSKTFVLGQRSPNRLELVKEFVKAGGSFCMIGGYLTFMGFEGKGCYKHSPLEEIMPIEFYCGDDRSEQPQGFSPEIVDANHPVLAGIDEAFPYMLGYNRTILKEGSTLIAKHGDDPIIAVRDYGKGRTMAYTCDCAPHWASLELCQWKYYAKLWQNIVRWLTKTEA